MTKLLALFLASSLTAMAANPCQRPILNRGSISAADLSELITIIRHMPDEVFTKNNRADIYSLVAPKLGPWKSLAHRKAAMAETLITLGAYESSWNWKEGIDRANPSSAKNKCNEEAGVFQTSANSMDLDPSLPALFDKHCGNYIGKTKCEKFIVCSKLDHGYVVEHTARLLRFTTRHHGPLIRKQDVYAHLSPACMAYIEGKL